VSLFSNFAARLDQCIFFRRFIFYRINLSSFISPSGEELWIGAIEPRPPGVARGLPWGPWGGDRARTKWLRPTKDTGGGGGGRYERQR